MISHEELQLAARNHGLPLEALRHDITPVGLHYLLVHYDVPVIDPAAWRLRVGGLVDRELSLSLDELQAGEAVSAAITFECAGNGRALLDPRPVSQPWLLEAVGTGLWTGVPLADVLRDAGVREEAVEVVFTGADRGVEGGEEQAYSRSLPIDVALDPDVLLVWGLNGGPLPPQHGFPLRLVVPGWYGMTNVKWLSEIRVLDVPFTGFQQERAYRMRLSEDEAGEPLSRMAPRSLMVPPGIPEFMTRVRHVDAGLVEIEGRAWSGMGEIASVEVSTDAGAAWSDASLEPALGRHAWRRWRFSWQAEPGATELRCRATDSTGRSQPDDPAWNVGGYANNAVHRVPVVVRSAAA